MMRISTGALWLFFFFSSVSQKNSYMSGEVVFQKCSRNENILNAMSANGHPYTYIPGLAVSYSEELGKFPTATRPLSGRVACES